MWEQLKGTLEEGRIDWLSLLDDRQRREIELSIVYARDFHHGTDGHNAKMIIAKLAEMLDAVQGHITDHDDEGKAE